MSMGATLAAEILPFVEKLDWQIDLVIPVPLSRKRLRERGYNQVAMIAMPLAMGLNVRYAPRQLVRNKETRTQVGLSRAERRENTHNAFQARTGVAGKTVLVVDDVATTGSTLSACAAALTAAGAKEVYALTVARALPQHGLGHA
jgi:ComF family protein